MANSRLTNPQPLAYHIEAGTKDGVLTAANQISDANKTTYNPDGSINNLVTVQNTLEVLQSEIDEKEQKIDSTHMISSDFVDDTNKTHKFVSESEKTAWNAKYDKPSTGIPEDDLSDGVKASLNKADTALQTHQDISGKQDVLSSTNKTNADYVDDTYSANKFVTSTEKNNWNAKYSKPASGIPSTDLAESVKNSLDKADTALQTHQDISGKQDKISATNTISSDFVDDTNKTHRFVTASVLEWIAQQMFEETFSCVITPATSNLDVFSANSPIVFTLTTKYNDALVDLDAVPTGWTRSSLGVYTKSVTYDITTGTQPAPTSGNVTCTYNSRSKVAAASIVTVTKPGYIILSDNSSLTAEQIAAAITDEYTFDNVESMICTRTINGSLNKYVYFITPAFREITVKQGVAAKVSVNDITISGRNIGDYYYYRSNNKMVYDSNTFDIS